MALIVIEGIDRTGKSTLAKYYESKGYEYIHLGPPPKELLQPGYVGPSYLDMILDIIQDSSHKNIVMDRSHYGELVWSAVYNRNPQLSEEDIEILQEIEEASGVTRILMTDVNAEAHWKRCVDNNEPLTKSQFVKAKSLFATVGHKYGFITETYPRLLQSDPEFKEFAEKYEASNLPAQSAPIEYVERSDTDSQAPNSVQQVGPTKEQLKLERANAINELLSKRILKSKGAIFDQLEVEIRAYLNTKLGELFGAASQSAQEFTEEEKVFLKALYKRATSK